MDLDGDGVLSMYELEFFYDEQCQKLEAMAIEPLPFEDCLCQMLDLVKPEVEGQDTKRLRGAASSRPNAQKQTQSLGHLVLSVRQDHFRIAFFFSVHLNAPR